jgi:signal transduction histidine kinase/ActR/RegA family two-component response regulator
MHAGIARYGVALAAVTIAFVARYQLESALGDVAPLLVFTVAVVVAAWQGGLRPGLLATAVSALIGDYFFIEPLHSFRIYSVAERIEVALFLCIGALISVLSQARLSLEAKRQQLLVSEREARRAAEAANRSKDEFLATVSHELRSPLNAILGWASILRLYRLDEAKADQALKTIERNAKIQSRLIEDLLDVSRIISGKLQMVSEPVRLTSIIVAAADVVRPAADAKGVQLRLNLNSSSDQVQGDPTRLQQIVWNLLTNAVKFTPAGGLVQLSLDASDSKALIKVTDTGRGISPQFLPFVFDRFRQAESASGGLGLGLAITRSLVEMHGGAIEARSAGEGKGAAFEVALPIMRARPEATSSPLPNDETREEEEATATLPDLSGLRILAVDDEAEVRDILAGALGRFGAQVITVASAGEAIDALSRCNPDVLISDLKMPTEDGFSLIRRVRSLGPTHGGAVPAIALTGQGRAGMRTRALSAGYQTFTAKPIEAADLAWAVVRLVNRPAKPRPVDRM